MRVSKQWRIQLPNNSLNHAADGMLKLQTIYIHFDSVFFRFSNEPHRQERPAQERLSHSYDVMLAYTVMILQLEICPLNLIQTVLQAYRLNAIIGTEMEFS
jgi:hypothetical protein